MKIFEYFGFNRGKWVVRERVENEETGFYDLWQVHYNSKSVTRIQVYLGISNARAKRIAKYHRLNFRPWACGMGGRKLKDKKYNNGCCFNFNGKKRKLVIRHPTVYTSVELSRTLISEGNRL